MSIAIRPATPRDATDIACLVDIAGHGIEAASWAGWVDDDQSMFAAARRMILTDDTLPHHFSKASILECDGAVAGCLVGECAAEQQELHSAYPDYFRPILELEAAVPGFWTVVSVAVYREFRGQGLSRLLLDHALILARQSGARGLSIVVEDINTKAINVYHRFGFMERERKPWLPYGHRKGPKEWVLLTRPLD